MASNLDKMTMSLDEIIKSAKSSKTGGKGSTRVNAKTKAKGKKAIKGVSVSKRASIGKKQQTGKLQPKSASMIKAKAGAAKGAIVKRGRKQIQQQKKKVAPNAATMQLVQKLVKKALAKTKVGRRSIVRTPIKSTIRRRVTGRIGGRVVGSIARGRIGKKQNIIQRQIIPRMLAQRPRILALPAVNHQLVRAPLAYSMVKTLPISRRGRQRKQFYQPPVAQQFIGGGNSIRSQVSAMRRRVVYVQPPAQQQFVMQPIQQRQRIVQYQRPPQQQQQYVQRFVQPQVVRRPQRNRQGQQQSRGQQQRRVIKTENQQPFYDPPNFLQRI